MWNPLYQPCIRVWPARSDGRVYRLADDWEVWDGSAWVPSEEPSSRFGRDVGDWYELDPEELRKLGISDPRVF